MWFGIFMLNFFLVCIEGYFMFVMNFECIILVGGCFWCLEVVYEWVCGVYYVENGYSNGQVLNLSYEQVCSGSIGYVEVVCIDFDFVEVLLCELLEVFFIIYDFIMLNCQGVDVGMQY